MKLIIYIFISVLISFSQNAFATDYSYARCADEPKEKISPISVNHYVELHIYLNTVLDMNPSNFNLIYKEMSEDEGSKVLGEVAQVVEEYTKKVIENGPAELAEPFEECFAQTMPDNILKYGFVLNGVNTNITFQLRDDKKTDVTLSVNKTASVK